MRGADGDENIMNETYAVRLEFRENAPKKSMTGRRLTWELPAYW
jgi:hypothetical protein